MYAHTRFALIRAPHIYVYYFDGDHPSTFTSQMVTGEMSASEGWQSGANSYAGMSSAEWMHTCRQYSGQFWCDIFDFRLGRLTTCEFELYFETQVRMLVSNKFRAHVLIQMFTDVDTNQTNKVARIVDYWMCNSRKKKTDVPRGTARKNILIPYTYIIYWYLPDKLKEKKENILFQITYNSHILKYI